ncbi:GxxExxY protein [Zhouia amylolytica]|uniref:GxxExxY protein n=1 Tax=Zhouia amylolytica AD3 TaxID=1286632 RepID=W2UQQ3_9FLAO|nr:GxxExxY protein [Zhouia amylolytica]ETN95801.1 hypothetical protein P278_15230 [Zhouia amylolytica AD3]
MGKLLFEDETYKIIGCCMSVHKELGPGFLESVYHEALGKEFYDNEVHFRTKDKLELYYKGEPMNKFFIADFVCYDKIILEIKASNFIHQSNEAQVINYLKSTNKVLGLLVNFGETSLKWKRFINTNPRN